MNKKSARRLWLVLSFMYIVIAGTIFMKYTYDHNWYMNLSTIGWWEIVMSPAMISIYIWIITMRKHL